MGRFRKRLWHILGPLYENLAARAYQPPDLSSARHFFFKPLISLDNVVVNDNAASALNHALRQAALTSRWQVHKLMMRKLKRGQSESRSRKEDRGYTIQMFDSVFQDINGDWIQFVDVLQIKIKIQSGGKKLSLSK